MRLEWPLPDEHRRITTQYGEVLQDESGKPYPHAGIDISAPDRTPVYAAHPGMAHYEWTDKGGNCVRLVGEGITTRYVHLGSYTLVNGASVCCWQELGRVGRSGSAWEGYHLHFEVIIEGIKVDPIFYLGEERVSVGSYHVQDPNPPAWLQALIQQSGVTMIKQINPDQMREPWQGLQVIGRLWWDGEPDRTLVARGSDGAEEWWQMARERIARCPWVQVWEGPNEVPIWNDVDAGAYNAFEVRRIHILHENGKQASSFQLSTGHPDAALLVYLREALERTDYLNLHAYGMRRIEPSIDTQHLLRYRTFIKMLKANGIRVPPIIISETGVDYAGNPNSDGWIAQGYTPEQYVAQLTGYLEEVEKDPEVRLVTPFGFAETGWPSFSIYEKPAQLYTEYLKSRQSRQAALLDLAEKWVIPMVPGFALWNHITGRGWVLASREFGYNGANYQWGYSRADNMLRLYRWQDGTVTEVYARRNQA